MKGRWLPANRLGVRREEIADDLAQLFEQRATSHGVLYAHARYCVDVVSVWMHALREPRNTPLPRRGHWTSDIARDAAYALRVFAAKPGGPLITVLGLGLAVGVGTSVFAIMNAVAFRPLGVPNPGAMKHVMRTSEGSISTNWSYGEAVALRERSPRVPLDIWIDAGGVEFGTRAGSDHPARIRVRFVGGTYFDLLGGNTSLGRMLAPGDDAAGAPVVVVSHQFWMRNLGSDPAAIGRTVWLNNAPFTLVGVTARTFSDSLDRPPALWLPAGTWRLVSPGAAPLDRASAADSTPVSIVARVPDGMSDSQAQAAVGTLASSVAAHLHGTDVPRGAGAQLAPLDDRFSGPVAAKLLPAIVSVLTAIGLLLLLACANVTNLLLASAAARQREIGVRLALGATRQRVIRQLLTESVLLGLAGGVLGLLAATWGLPVLMTAVRVPGDLDVRFDTTVFVFLTFVSMLAGIGAGLAPARYGTRGDLSSSIKGRGASGGVSPRGWLIGAQAAASVVLLILAGLLTRAATNAARVDLGFDPEKLVTMSPSFGNHGYDADEVAAFWDTALPRIRALPGVEAASLATFAPLGNGAMVARLDKHVPAAKPSAGSSAKGRPRPYTVFFNEVGAEYFSTVGVGIVRGRAFTADEVRRHAPVVVISEAVAQEFWGDVDPLGLPFDRISADAEPPRIIGIAANVVTMQLRNSDGAAVYQPLSAQSLRGALLVTRTSGRPESMIEPLRAAIRGLDPRLHPTAGLISENLERQLNEPRTLATLAGAVGMLALALALVGIYGVAACMVGQRTPEIGLRLAIGATLTDVLVLLLRDTLRPVVIGLGVGAIVAVLCARALSAALYGVSAYDPVALVTATGLLSAAATLAAWLPARRAARVDPVDVLRS